MGSKREALDVLRRILIAISVLVAALVVAAVSLPWWLGGVLRWQGSKQGLQFSEYEAVGYTRWSLTDARIEQPSWSVEIDRLEAAHPWLLWRQPTETELIATGVRVRFNPSSDADTSASVPVGPREVYEILGDLTAQLPIVLLEDVELVGLAKYPLSVGQVRWVDRRLVVEDVAYQRWQGEIYLHREADGMVLTATSRADDWRVVARAPLNSLAADIEGHWLEQPISGKLALGDDVWRPELIELNLQAWSLDAGEVGLSAGYATVRGSTFARWEQDRFSVESNWQGDPLPDSGYSRIDVRGSAQGDERSIRVEALEVSLPGLALILDQPLEIDHNQLQSETRSNFRADLDLAAFPWLEGSGQVTGELAVQSVGLGWPHVEYRLRTANASWRDGPELSGAMTGSLEWPRWSIRDAKFKDESGNQISLAGEGMGAAIADLEWSSSLDGRIMSRWLDDRFAIEQVAAQGTLSGEWPDLEHAGTVETEAVVFAGLKPVSIAGTWRGLGLAVDGQTTLQTGTSEAAVDFKWADGAVELRASLQQDDALVWRFLEPARIHFGEGFGGGNLRIEGRDFTANSDEFSAENGSIRFSLTRPDWSWLADWLESSPEIPTIRSAEGELAWAGDELTGTVDYDGDVPVGENQVIGVVLKANSDGDSLQVASGEFYWKDALMARLQGRVPVGVSLTSPYWEINDNGSIDAQLKLAENDEVWQAMSELTQIDVRNPRLELTLAGTWREPRGQGFLAVDQITFEANDDEEFVWPVVSAVEAKLIDDGTGIVVDPLTAKIDGQLITFNGQVPFTPSEWADLSQDPLAYFRDRGRGNLSIPRAELSAFAKFLPAYLVPTGELEVALRYAPETGTHGRIELQRAVSKPLGPLGVLQEISAKLLFANRSMTIEKVAASMGGQPLEINGSAGWPQRGGAVELELALRGENLPIVRKTGVLLRSDLDLRINSDASGAGKVSGEARLRDGLVLVDVRSLVPRGGTAVAVPTRRPPYFSISVPPLNSWDLDVKLRGEDFLRLRTPVITGVGSLRARLEGTLQSPLLLGELELREADLRLPFARLDVDEAIVRLTEADPYDPEIWLEANGQRLGYDLRLELEGKASSPQLTLQSSPSLTAEQVLMLVMAGVTPTDETDLVNSDRAMRLGMYFGQGLLGDLFGTDERERLSVSTGEKLSRLGKETYEFEYEIADRWSVVGEYDEFDYYNAALKWRVRPGKPESEPVSASAEEPSEEDEDE
jgi:translocation and assembly module TamB